MAIRAGIARVKSLIASQGLAASDFHIGEAIRTANALVEQDLGDRGLAEALLTEIEVYLSAHFLALREIKAGISTRRADDAAETYTLGVVSGTGELISPNIGSTHFGQVAIALDTTGALSKSGQQQATFQVLSVA